MFVDREIAQKTDQANQYRMDGDTTCYTLDLNAGLTQVLSDGTYTYLYGAERIYQQAAAGKGYFLDDALGSVRQLVDGSGAVIQSESYQPVWGGIEHFRTCLESLTVTT